MAIHPVKLSNLAPGLNNRLEPTQLADGEGGTFLYAATNVDINDKGYLRRRRGTTLALDGDSHSMWSDERGAYAVRDDVLVELVNTGAALSARPIREGMHRLPVSFSRGGDGEVYWASGAEIRRISKTGEDRPIVTPPLERVPDITAAAGGALSAGRYLVALTVVSQDGESPATDVVQLEVPENGSIVIDDVDQLAEVYLSGPNGEVPQHATQAGIGGATIVTLANNGRRCPTLNRSMMPAGSIVRHYAGSMLVANGSVLFVSDAYNYGVFDASKGYIGMPGLITMVEPVENGVYVSTDAAVYWLTDPRNAGGLADVLPYGALPRSSGQSPNDKTVYWHSSHGLVIADGNGQAKSVQDHAMEFGQASSGASLFRQQNGITQVITSRFGAEESVAIATSYLEAELIRKGQ